VKRLHVPARLWISAVLTVAWSVGAAAQQRQLTLDDIYDPAGRINFSGNVPSTLTWMDASRYVMAQQTPAGVAWVAVDAPTGVAAPLYDAARMEAALRKLPDVAASDAARIARSRELTFDAAFTAAVFSLSDDLYFYRLNSDDAVRLTNAPGEERLASISPDRRRVAFVRDHDLHVADVASAREIALTADGAARILNGELDWVYEEEIYGRGERRAYWWSPDSSRLAFLRIDDTPVPVFTVVDDIPYDQRIERWDYPKAGDPNPQVTLGIVSSDGGAVTWADLRAYPADDRLIVRVGWAPDSAGVAFSVQNRLQSWLELNIADVKSGAARTLLRETSRTFIDPGNTDPPAYMKDGTFLWLSERSGWKHLYHYRSDGSLLRQVTSGKWEVRTFHGVDSATGWIYFSGTERSHVGGDVYRIRLDGTGLTRTSHARGTHAARFDPSFTYYIDSWSDATTPTQVRLHRNDGSAVREISENHVEALSRFKLSTPEFLQVPTRDGFLMEAMMIKPPGFSPSRRYPVYQFTYGGPASPRVLDAWRGTEYMFHQLLAQMGIIVWICDNRTASGKGAESVWPVYRNFGEVELRDIEDGIAWLKRQSYVDASRVGIHGWSYGGYLTSYALTHSTSFVMGIAGGTVADWRNYDTVYTERYMGLPSEAAEAYRKSSPRWSAPNLSGALLLIHGAIDDNVHLANTMQFAHELQRANKPFEMMLYPRSRHGVTDPAQIKHLRATMVAFIARHLKPQIP
jgi:dipeptidyl-peptidase-4